MVGVICKPAGAARQHATHPFSDSESVREASTFAHEESGSAAEPASQSPLIDSVSSLLHSVLLRHKVLHQAVS